MSTTMKRACKDAAEQTSAAMGKEIEEYELVEAIDDSKRFASAIDFRTFINKTYRRMSKLEAKVSTHTAQHAQWEAEDKAWKEKAQEEVNTEAGVPKPQLMPVGSLTSLSDEKVVFPETFRPPLVDAFYTETPQVEAEDLPRFYSTRIYSNEKLPIPNPNDPQLVDRMSHDIPYHPANNNSGDCRNVINDTDKPQHFLDEEGGLEYVNDTITPYRPADVKDVLRISFNDTDIFENIRSTLLFLGFAWLVLVGLHVHIKFFGLAIRFLCQWLSS
ncbi:MAG: hypothetical protein M1824_002816 [Vezdaea acicularis]|nr:MAG: hypothetical protein M1824_002816 [Vezdaea acicularis]